MKKVFLGVVSVATFAGILYFLNTDESSAETDIPKATLVAIAPIDALFAEDSAVTMVIAVYPDSVRSAILTVCEYPDAVLRIEELQKNTQQDFRTITGSLNQESQAAIWNITRYDGLAEKLAGSKQLSKSELDTLAVRYPEDVRKDIVKCGSENYEVVKQVTELNRTTAVLFDSLVRSYPTALQNDLRIVVGNPEIMELLGGNMRLTVKAGDLHRTEHDKLHRQLDSLNTVLAVQKAKEVQEWKEGLEKNPAAKAEFDSATTEYKQQHNTVNETTIVNETVVVNYVCYPYSYWYGYPYWYNYPYWYPYPYWYASGYYYGPYGIVYFGYPTPYYTWWYFYGYHHHYHYCHFSDYYIDHHYGHRRTANQSGRVVDDWIAAEEPRVGKAFFANDVDRPTRFEQLGRAEIDRADYNSKNPTAQLTRDEYVRNNQAKYPDVKPNINQGNTTPQHSGTPPPPPPSGQQSNPGAARPPAPSPSPKPAPVFIPPSPKGTPAPPPRPNPPPQQAPVPKKKPK